MHMYCVKQTHIIIGWACSGISRAHIRPFSSTLEFYEIWDWSVSDQNVQFRTDSNLLVTSDLVRPEP